MVINANRLIGSDQIITRTEFYRRLDEEAGGNVYGGRNISYLGVRSLLFDYDDTFPRSYEEAQQRILSSCRVAATLIGTGTVLVFALGVLLIVYSSYASSMQKYLYLFFGSLPEVLMTVVIGGYWAAVKCRKVQKLDYEDAENELEKFRQLLYVNELNHPREIIIQARNNIGDG